MTDTKMVLKFVSQKIRVMRKKRNLTQMELTDCLKVSRPSLVNIENGKQNIGIERLVEIADALNCDLKDLIPKIR